MKRIYLFILLFLSVPVFSLEKYEITVIRDCNRDPETKEDREYHYLQSEFIFDKDAKKFFDIINEYEEIPDGVKQLYDSSFTFSEFLYVNSKDGLRVRSSDDLNSKKLCVIPNGKLVLVDRIGKKETIDGIDSFWVHISIPEELCEQAGQIDGWVFGGYLVFNWFDIDGDGCSEKISIREDTFNCVEILLSKTNRKMLYYPEDADYMDFNPDVKLEYYLLEEEKIKREFIIVHKIIGEYDYMNEDGYYPFHYEDIFYAIDGDKLVKVFKIKSEISAYFYARETGFGSTLDGEVKFKYLYTYQKTARNQMQHDDIIKYKLIDKFPYIIFNLDDLGNYVIEIKGTGY